MSEQTQPGKSETAKREEEIVAFWRSDKTFEKSLAKPSPKGEFVFYDGPPFATGLPHQGSLLSSVIKDVVPRYKTMRGYHVRRRWGWDTHGLPIESLVEKKLELKTKKDILDIGVAKFNETARSMVLQYVDDWKKYIERIGRWVDYENSYKTMDNSYIESVWWALKQLWDKELLYEGRKVLMYCPHCETPLAKAEIAMDNTYKDITEEAVTVRFKIRYPAQYGLPENTHFLAWTTTPWTLPGNVALAVGPDITYVLAAEEGGMAIVARDRLEILKKGVGPKVSVDVGKEFKGSELVGIQYEPLYDISAAIRHSGKRYTVVPADFVKTDEGTGIVHTAVMYGEDDFLLGQKENLPMVQLLDASGKYNTEAPQFVQGKYIKAAERDIKKDLQDRGLLFARENNTHSYPHCYRCGTPLIYNAVASWFINIQKVKAKMISENKGVQWVPEHLRDGRFGNIVENAPDWTISRNRFWASPLPVWKSKEGKVMVVGSLEELKKRSKRSGNTYVLMRHGEADTNATDIINSDIDAPMHLTDKGKSAVQKAARSLAGKVDVIFASPLVRTKETAALVAAEIGIPQEAIIIDERLKESMFGPQFSGKSINEWHQAFPDREDRFIRAPEGGETFAQIQQRVGEFISELEKTHKGKRILIVSHATPLWLLEALARGASRSEAMEMCRTSYPQPAEVRPLDFAPLPWNARFELDLHRPYTDDIVLIGDDGQEYLRIPEVVDCWVESGAMPFAELHYPFENKKQFESTAPGDFIAEYIAQTRTWFYYMHALGVLLFERKAFKAVVSTGTIVAADGQKMSKSKGNYTDPLVLLDKYGADAMRLYMMGSPVMQAEDLRFRDEELRDTHNRMIGILWNTFKFFDLYQKEYDGKTKARKSGHVLDTWILARLDETVASVTAALDAYHTPDACRAIKSFVDDYSTWYVRRSRERVKEKGADAQFALASQREVLLTLAKLLAPIAPFLAESIWRGTTGEGSVHLQEWPEPHHEGFFAHFFGSGKADPVLEEMAKVRAFVSKALQERDKAGIKVRQPLGKLSVGGGTSALDPALLDVIKDEVNVKSVEIDATLPEGEVRLDTEMTPELKEEGVVRETIRAVQDARKNASLRPGEHGAVSITVATENREIVLKNLPAISAQTNTDVSVS